jgi:SAM-dependent methyltransferase
MNETTKTLQLLSAQELSYLTGRGIDIGCGLDPVRPDVERFDLEQGDANRITSFVSDVESFDFVFSSHCLEHMRDADLALKEWWKLVKPGGVLIVVVPDEDLYEQGYWPSLFNSAHKSTFSISKQRSWSPVSRNLADMTRCLPDAEPISVRLQDNAYNRAYLAPGVWPWSAARLAVGLRRLAVRLLPPARLLFHALFVVMRLPIDQTEGEASAQNILVVAKRRLEPP